MNQSQPAPATFQAARRIARWVRGLGSAALDLIYPPVCPGCDDALLESPPGDPQAPPLCAGCEARLDPLVPPFCRICGQAYESGGALPFACANCADRTFAFDFATAPFLARGLLRDMIHRFKFGRELALRQPLGRLLALGMQDPRLGDDNWLLVPVPIHPRRQRQRTFNQSAELARVLSRECGFPVADALARVKFTPPQSRLNRSQRLDNLAAAIETKSSCRARLSDRPVLLVDDVLTTGSTAHTCASVLRSAGARKVVVITLARG